MIHEIQDCLQDLYTLLTELKAEHSALNQVDRLSGEGNILREKINTLKGEIKSLEWVMENINESGVDKEIQIIKNIAHRIRPFAKSKNIEKIDLCLDGREVQVLSGALEAVLTYYSFTKAVEHDPEFTNNKFPKS